jgi:hypothetical protein
MENYFFDEANHFIISDYQNQRPFASLLPGLGGSLGIPMWIFYVNRGQCIAGFGVEDKNHSIMEFQPANKAYRSTSILGFRTFIKLDRKGDIAVYEPFNGASPAERQMRTNLCELELIEKSDLHNLQVEVLYYNLPGERIAGLIRQVKIINLNETAINLELLDGLPVMIPYGVSNISLKENSRTIEAWMEVLNLDNKIPFYHLRSTIGDTTDVRPIKAGNYAHAFSIHNHVHNCLTPIVNPETIFGSDSSLKFPREFQEKNLNDLRQPSYNDGKTPCAIFGNSCVLKPQESITLYSIYGYAESLNVINSYHEKLKSKTFFAKKRLEAQQLMQEIVRPISTKTASRAFNAYSMTTYLDNILRGGWPSYFGEPEKSIPYHIYFRKHGDPERDYNAFYLAPEFFSYGNGNYRDINQNRRNEVWFHPKVNDINIRAFMSLIQSDGYNPLNVKGTRFWVPFERRDKILLQVDNPEKIKSFFEKSFTPGELLKEIFENKIGIRISQLDFLNNVLLLADDYFDAEFGEGYWIDHWTYNLDLLESYLAIYPDREHTLLFEKKNILFFESDMYVLPRSRKYVLVDNKPRQFGALLRDEEKTRLIASRKEYSNFTHTKNGCGEVYRTTLHNKLIFLAIIKFSTMDPLGIGIEMEAGRPGWCDALNGLPGLFGSSMSETFELSRLLSFLINLSPFQDRVSIFVEARELLQAVSDALVKYVESLEEDRDFLFWDRVSNAREIYRERTRLGFDGEEVDIPYEEILHILNLMLVKVNSGIEKALQMNQGLPPTYFTYEIDHYEVLTDSTGETLRNVNNDPLIRALSFKLNVLPLFLEGVVRQFKILDDIDSSRALYKKVKSSCLYDPKLKMYKTNESLRDQSLEIGRLRIFTPGWLENESVFLHMEYKYLLAILKAGLYEEFFDNFEHALVAFQNPKRYGRSPLENSSFIVSSAHPDEDLHGTGFVARLTGATAEFLEMWNLMMVGKTPFFVADGEINLQLKPALPGWLFDNENMISFNFLGKCNIAYHNNLRKDTYSENMCIKKIDLYLDEKKIELNGNIIPSPYASLVRENSIQKIEAYF